MEFNFPSVVEQDEVATKDAIDGVINNIFQEDFDFSSKSLLEVRKSFFSSFLKDSGR